MAQFVLFVKQDDMAILQEALIAYDKYNLAVKQINVLEFNRLGNTTGALNQLMFEDNGSRKLKEIKDKESVFHDHYLKKREEHAKFKMKLLAAFDSEGKVRDDVDMCGAELDQVIAIFEFYISQYIPDVAKRLYAYTDAARELGVMSDVGETYLESLHFHETARKIRSSLDLQKQAAARIRNGILNHFTERNRR